MSDPHGSLAGAARRGTQRAQQRFRSRWLRIGFVELMFVVVVLLAALFMRGALHPGVLAAASGTVTTPTRSTTAPSFETSGTPTSRTPTRTPIRTATRASHTTSGPTSRGPISPGPPPAGNVVNPTADQVKPNTGPPGALVDIGGQQLDSVVSVLFGKFDTVVLPGRSAQVIQVRVPNGNVPGTKVPITLETKTGQVATQLVFAYDPISPVTPP